MGFLCIYISYASTSLRTRVTFKKRSEIEMQKYEILEVIGKGSFSLVRKVRRISDGLILCRKEIDYKKMTTQEKSQLVSEVTFDSVDFDKR